MVPLLDWLASRILSSMFRDDPGLRSLMWMAAFAVVALMVTAWQLITGFRVPGGF